MWTWGALPVWQQMSVQLASSRRWMLPCVMLQEWRWSQATTSTTLRAPCCLLPPGLCQRSTRFPWSYSDVITEMPPCQDWMDYAGFHIQHNETWKNNSSTNIIMLETPNIKAHAWLQLLRGNDTMFGTSCFPSVLSQDDLVLFTSFGRVLIFNNITVVFCQLCSQDVSGHNVFLFDSFCAVLLWIKWSFLISTRSKLSGKFLILF